MKIRLSVISAIALLVLCVSNLLAETWYIKPDGTGDAPTIQAGIDLASEGDTVLLANGTYSGNGNREIYYDGKAITVRSQDGDPSLCIIDCEGGGRGFYFLNMGTTAARLEGVSIINGMASGVFPDYLGGGINCYQSSPAIINCRISSCTGYSGGGISCYLSSPMLSYCTFSDNLSSSGGGIFCHAFNGTINNCTFSNNSADIGAGMRCSGGSDLIMVNCTFSQNNASLYGGGIFCEAADLRLENTIVAFSTGGEALNCGASANVTIICSDLYGNVEGDWVGCIEAQAGTNGNMSLNPRFCPDGSSDEPYTLRGESPCAPDNNPGCGLIGAWPVGCGSEGFCVVEPGTLAFGHVPLGEYRDKTLTIKNIIGDIMIGSIEESCDHFSILSGGGSYALEEGESLVATVRFEPTQNGQLTCQVTTGNGSCGEILSTGYGEPPGRTNCEGNFNGVRDVAVDLSGNVYVTDIGNYRIQVFSSDGTFIRKWSTFDADEGRFYAPSFIAVDSEGNAYVTDLSNRLVHKYNSNGTFVKKWGGQSIWFSPWGIAVDSNNDVYVADHGETRIEKYDSDGNFLLSWGGQGIEDGQFPDDPNDITVDSNEYVYVVTRGSRYIHKFTNTGGFVEKFWIDDLLQFPFGIVVDSEGNIYAADQAVDKCHIQKFSSDGTHILTWGSYGSADGLFVSPFGIAIDADDNVYVADSGNDRIQKFSSEGTFIGKWGSECKASLCWALFPEYLSTASDTTIPPGNPFYFDQVSVLLTHAEGDTFYISGMCDSLASWIVADELHIRFNSTGPGHDGDKGLGFPIGVPVDSIFNSVPARDVTDFIPFSSYEYSVSFQLADLQRTVYGSTAIYLIKKRGPGQQVSAALKLFTAERMEHHAIVRWEFTDADLDFAAFELFREVMNGPREKISGELLSGSTTYEFVDESASPKQTNYWLRGISKSGSEQWYGPARLDATDVVKPALSLANNYPNPFNPATTILYSLPDKGPVTIALYDISGRLVKTLVNEIKDPGNHETSWNAVDNSGLPVATGVYIVRLEFNGSVLTQKITLLK